MHIPVPVRRRLFSLLIGHLLLSAATAGAFAWQFGHSPRAVWTHVWLVAEWDVALVGLLPFLLMTLTSFVKISTVLHIARSAIGPPLTASGKHTGRGSIIARPGIAPSPPPEAPPQAWQSDFPENEGWTPC